MKKLLTITLLALSVSGCEVLEKENPLKKEYKEKHEKYRTLWYRSGFSDCYYDSSKKYGELYWQVMGWNKPDFNTVDTVPVNEPINCD